MSLRESKLAYINTTDSKIGFHGVFNIRTMQENSRKTEEYLRTASFEIMFLVLIKKNSVPDAIKDLNKNCFLKTIFQGKVNILIEMSDNAVQHLHLFGSSSASLV